MSYSRLIKLLEEAQLMVAKGAMAKREADLYNCGLQAGEYQGLGRAISKIKEVMAGVEQADKDL